ncbi:MAG: ATP-binding cassette domain-containing protein [Bacteroidetes bacterium]|nr:ATP-binding cassette domain-containing protein [Bacteroidota bacterium]
MDKIIFDKVIPLPVKETFSPLSDVWGKEVTFDQGLNFHVCAPSGTGKTTLSHILYGLRHDYNGEVLMDDKKAKNFSPDQWSLLRQTRISIIYQDLKLLEEYTGIENIQIKNRLTNFFTTEEIIAHADKLGITRLLEKPCKQMSRGERQRVCILRALSQPFKYLILDEAFSHLDEGNTNKGIALINEIAQKNSAGVISCNLFEDSHFNYHKKLKL